MRVGRGRLFSSMDKNDLDDNRVERRNAQEVRFTLLGTMHSSNARSLVDKLVDNLERFHFIDLDMCYRERGPSQF